MLYRDKRFGQPRLWTRPAAAWLDHSTPATYRRSLIWIAALSLGYYGTAVAGYASLMIPSLPSTFSRTVIG